MKKKTFMLMLAALFVLKAAAQQVEAVQRTLLTKRTASWCPNCGAWGWTMFNNIIADNQDKAVIIAAHHDGILKVDAAEELTDNFGGFYQPRFFLNQTDINVTSGNIAAKRTETKAAVDAAFNTTPIANVGFAPTFANELLSVEAKVKFFQPTSGDFYVGIYLLEDNVIAFQQNQGANANHKKVFRASFTDGTFGLPVVNGNVSQDAEFNLSFGLALTEVEGYDYEVVGIVWKKENNKYIPVNTWSTKNIGEASSTLDVPGVSLFSVMPNVVSDRAVIQVDLQENLLNATLSVLNTQGQIVAVVAQGNMQQGSQSFPLDKSMLGSNGLYFVRLSDGKNSRTERVVFQ